MDGPLPPNLAADWEVLLRRGAGAKAYEPCDAVFNHGTLFPLQRKAELRKMLELAAGAKVIVEIGADKGGGVFHWCAAIPFAQRVIAIELRGVPYADSFRRHFPLLDFYGIAESSYAPETVERVRSIVGSDGIDVLFLDGDKSHYDTDFALYSPLVRSGGLIFFHDVQDDIPPRYAFNAASVGRQSSVILDTAEGAEALVRKSSGAPPRTAHEGWLYHWGESSCGVGVVIKP